MINNILFVCTGNVCRSPMAEGLFRYNLATETQVSSAGLHALVGKPAVLEANNVMVEKNIDISAHKARQLTSQMLLNADLVLVMEEFQKQQIEEINPHAKGRVFLLGHWSGYEVFDPFRQPEDAFKRCFKLIEQGWHEWKQKIC